MKSTLRLMERWFIFGAPLMMKELFSMLSSKEDEAQKLPYNLLRKLLRNQGIRPTRIITDRLGSYGAALRLLGLKHLQDIRVRKNNRAECSHVPIRRRERKSQRFRSVRNAQMLLSAHGQIYNLFNYRRHLLSKNTLRKIRQQAQVEWNLVTITACV